MKHPFTGTIESYSLHFIHPAGTSRGVYLQHNVWYIRLFSTDNPSRFGIGECAPLPDLSCDALPDYEEKLREACHLCELTGKIDYEAYRNYPSIIFGLETALLNFEQGNLALFETSFSKGLSGIPINGLIWMGPFEDMVRQVEKKIALGYQCIKLKIGSLDFETELELLKKIRNKYSKDTLTLRVDANGAFSPDSALEKLECLSRLAIHSIEQPIKAGQWQEMARLTACSPLPIALDEELIGYHTWTEKKRLLEAIHPQYIVLKPTLHGGFSGCLEWIQLADSMKIGWWITSALESNIGLNAIAQWCATFNSPLHQGLGTGKLYDNNIESPLYISGEKLWFDPVNSHLRFSEHFSNGLVNEGAQFSGFITERSKQTMTLEGTTYTWESLQQAVQEHPDEFSCVRFDLIEFLQEWFNEKSTIQIKTSGSTGKPSVMTVQKKYLIQSACLTCSYFGLKPGEKLLLCLSLNFIAGKMMVIRALVGGLDLYLTKPDGHPLKDLTTDFSFASMVPMQVFNTLGVPDERDRLTKIKTLLLGGGPIDPTLESTLQAFPDSIVVSYGMAETLSHIALRRVNGKDASLHYHPLPSVRLSVSETGCLIIDAPLVSEKRVYTNDLAEIFPDGSFCILGRKDNTIVTGGLKVQIETLEASISSFLPVPFAITSMPDAKFGEVVCLVSEQPVDESLLARHLTGWQVPKHIFIIPALPRTQSGKLDRAAIKQFILSQK